MGMQPKLRFKGFTDDWEKRRLRDISKISAGGDVNKDKLTKIGKYPVLANALTNDGIIGYYEDYKVKAPAVTVTGRGDVGHAKARHISYTPTVRLLSVQSDDFDVNFLENSINHTKIFIESTGVPQLTSPQLGSVYITFPSLKEQTIIGKFLRNLDNLIAVNQRKVDLLKRKKAGYLQKLFPKNGQNNPELRFKGYTDAWEKRKLENFTKSYSGGTPSVSKSDYYGGEIPFIRSAEINSDSTDLYLTEVGLKNSSAKMVQYGDILYALYGATSGEVGISRIHGAINQAILAIKPTEGDDSQFIMQWLRKQKGHIINTYLQGGQGNLSGSIVKSLEVRTPVNKNEEFKIGGLLRKIDNLIAVNQRKVDLLKREKKALLQKMFV
ncbi:restriction endonuclease subunit S [Weissella paramesenteroides]|uniref:restriction endonuclease subunit S n=1 Tax=Weissella paramesenteroides TaxID=1249 RepID=UPI001C1F36BD|nr:restriction endonuclease subunit S [Weissella paramesenteroides]MBU7556065.1 restriction endonuclease subunit S [Weissella paramesenteroides]